MVGYRENKSTRTIDQSEKIRNRLITGFDLGITIGLANGSEWNRA